MPALKYKDKNGNWQQLSQILVKGINVVQTTGTSTVDVMSQSAVTESLQGKADASALADYATTAITEAISGAVSAHTEDTDIHVTSADKTAWGAKLDSSAIADFFDDAKYEDSGTSKVINFYHGDTIKATINADEFIKDGMISGVTLESKSGTTYLVIDWNTDAGIQTTELNIGDIFEADNYYAKSDTSGKTEISDALNLKVDKTALDDKLGSGFTGANSANTVTSVIEENERVTSSALNDLQSNKLDVSAFTEYSGTVDTTIGSKASQSDLNTLSGTVTAHTADTDIHVTTGDKATWNAKLSSGDVITAITSENSGSTAPVATKVVAENELVVSTALNTLSATKADLSHTHEASGVTAMTGYQVAASSASVLTTDSLLVVIGKLEKRIVLLETALGGIKLVKLTSQEYADLTIKDPDTFYIIND